MSTPPWLVSIAHGVATLSVFAILVATPLLVFVTPAWARYQYARQGFPASPRFSPEERQHISETILHYLRGRASLAEMAETRTETGDVALNDDEVQHMVDVKVVVDGFYRVYAASLLLLPACLYALWRSEQRMRVVLSVRHGVWIVGGLMLLMLISSFVDFNVFFTRFHQVFFKPGSWVFYETDTLIQLYPLSFWIDTVWKLSVTILIESVLVLSVTFALAPRLART